MSMPTITEGEVFLLVGHDESRQDHTTSHVVGKQTAPGVFDLRYATMDEIQEYQDAQSE